MKVNAEGKSDDNVYKNNYCTVPANIIKKKDSEGE